MPERVPGEFPKALPNDRLAWRDREIELDGRTWEAVDVGVGYRNRLCVRVHIGQNRWRTATRPDGGEWEWGHYR